LSQIRSNPELIVKNDNLHFSTLTEHQIQIEKQYDEGKLIQPTFQQWVRVKSEAASQLFPKMSFYSIAWAETPRPGAKNKQPIHLVLRLEKTIGINQGTGKIEAELYCSGNYEAFGELLIKHKAALRNPADAKKIWEAFCEIHHKHWQEYPLKKISDTEWHLGISSYDQIVSTTEESSTVVTQTHYMQVVIDKESGRILSWKSKVDTSNKRTLPK
jgi:hypothetical protein